MLEEIQGLLDELNKPDCEVPSPSYIAIMLKYFIATLALRDGDLNRASQYAQQMLDIDIRSYFGHMQSDISIEPMLIILNQKFEQLTQTELSATTSHESKLAYGALF